MADKVDNGIPCLSFIGIVDFSQEAKWLYITGSVSDLLGYEPHELEGRPSLELVHPDEMTRVRKLHYDTIRQDKAACLVYLRMKHKNPHKGYILCGISRTIVHNVTVGSVSFANSSAKTFHNNSTAQEITVLSPSFPELQFRRWHDPAPMPPTPIPSALRLTPKSWRDGASPSSSPEPEEEEGLSYDPLPSQSFRTALILDRFSTHCTIMYKSNDLLITSNDSNADPRSFFDFVAKKDEARVRTWIETVKTWGVNERGQPSDGGFGFAGFTLLAEGRDHLNTRHRASLGEGREHLTARQRHSSNLPVRPKNHKSNIRGPSSASRAIKTPTIIEPEVEGESLVVDAIFSAHSDGILVILRRSA